MAFYCRFRDKGEVLWSRSGISITFDNYLYCQKEEQNSAPLLSKLGTHVSLKS